MTEHADDADPATMPALLRAAQRTYAAAVAEALAGAGCGDMPRDGSLVVTAIGRSGAPLGQIIRDLGASKQAGGQLVDALVTRGYLARSPDPADRRRQTITPTERGRAAAAAARRAVERVDRDLVERAGRGSVEHTRASLRALAEANAEAEFVGRLGDR